MKITIITVFPEIHEPFIATSLIGKAIEKGLISCSIMRLSSLVSPKERIDEPTAGPGSGMIIKPELIEKAINQVEQEHGKGIRVFFSPQGIKLDQQILRQLGQKLFQDEEATESTTDIMHHEHNRKHLILICSRYEGIDARVEAAYADLTISIGDYVLMGGDIPAQVFLEGILRMLPGIIGKQESVEQDSFSGALLDYPEYGLPVEWQGMKIPEIVLSGNHAKIAEWRKSEACKNTVKNRFDWFISQKQTPEELQLARTHIPNHYLAVMHTQIMLKGGQVGESSIASLDIHDIARSSATYGIKNFFIVSPLKDQRSILDTFLDFWRSNEGLEYNKSRYKSMQIVDPVSSLDDAVAAITQKEGKKPLLIATSAKQHNNITRIDYHSQNLVWQFDRPVLLVFGTGQGLADVVLDRCDYLLAPIYGISDYNHLSVRAAASIILDRWLGLDERIYPEIELKKAPHKGVD